MVILKEMMQEGYIINRHIDTLFKENAIGSFDDLEIKELIFVLDENIQYEYLPRKSKQAESLLRSLGLLEPSVIERNPLSPDEAWI